ncbi:MAG TPA: fumarylacetoacetate hydrolase family protein [Solirubrobacteraceae bacterium]|nr:fumarylacetoacetate hydrolase family protein [Solirubrobacteraceae bacterium]
MRLVTYGDGAGTAPGVLVGEQVVPAAAAAAQAGIDMQPRSVRMLLASLSAAELVRLGEAARDVSGAHDRASLTLHAPVANPQKVICLGLNYRDHARETGQPIPQAPMWFAKFANSLIGDGQPVVLPAAHPDRVDYEAELAVVIGKTARGVSARDALSCVAGAMPFNDVSARDLQMQNPLWTAGKAIDTFAPCGPALVTLDEIEDLQALALQTRVNGEVVQEGNTSDQIFTVAEVVAWLSRTMTLVPGDIIATGTPAGIGAARRSYLSAGDTVAVEVQGLGAVSNAVVAEAV